MSQTYVFGGSPVQPSQVSYSDLALTADTELQWPWVDQDTDSAVPLYLYVTPTGAYSITMPDATGAGPGQAVIIFNVGASTITILDNAGGAITTITAGIAKYLILRSNATAAGTWQSQTFGAGSNAVDAAALAGYGLSALSGATLNSNAPVVPVVTTSVTATPGYRAQVFEVTSATGAGTLSFNPVSTLGNGWWMGFSNLGTGAWTLDPDGSETIDGQSTITLNPTETCLIFSSGSALFTIGRGRSVDFVYTALNKDVAGNTDVTLTSTEASNLLINFFGTLTGNINVIVPSVVNEYMIRNTTTGAFTLTVKTAAGAGIIATQGEQAFIKCDGTDCFNVVTNVPVTGTSSMPDGSAALPGLAFENEATTGFYRPSAGVLGFAVLGNAIFTATASGLDLNSKTIVSLAAATTATGAANLGQVQSNAAQFVGTVGGTGNAITLTPAPAISAYAAGQEFWFIAGANNTGATTVATSGLATRAVQANGAALVSGDIVSGRLVGIKDNGTNYQLIASRGAVDHTADIADSAVTTAKIADSNVTTAKIADLNVTTGKLADNAVTFAKMQAITDGRLLGASGGTAVEEITVGTGLSLSSNTLSLSGTLGKVVQQVHTVTGATASGANTGPAQTDTIPTTSNGTLFMSQAVTPTSAANLLRVDVTFCGSVSTISTNGFLAAWLTLDSETDARAAAAISPTSVNQSVTVSFTYWMTAGSTSAMTFKVYASGRVSGGGSVTTYFNGISSGRVWGGTQPSSISITEYAV